MVPRFKKILALVKIWWKEEKVKGSKMFSFVTKLKSLKLKIKEWNRTLLITYLNISTKYSYKLNN